jgi:hypothetical protein
MRAALRGYLRPGKKKTKPGEERCKDFSQVAEFARVLPNPTHEAVLASLSVQFVRAERKGRCSFYQTALS